MLRQMGSVRERSNVLLFVLLFFCFVFFVFGNSQIFLFKFITVQDTRNSLLLVGGSGESLLNSQRVL